MRGASTLAMGTLGSQAILAASATVLTRLYTPAEFGVYGVFVGCAAVISVLACLRYDLSLSIPENDQDAFALAVAGLFSNGALTLIGIGVIVSGPLAASFPAALGLDYVSAFSLTAILLGISQLAAALAMRMRAFASVSLGKVSQAVIMVSIQIGAFSVGAVALIWAHIFGIAVSAILMLLALRRRFGGRDLVPAATLICHQAMKYKNFPLFSTWSGVAATAGMYLPQLILAKHDLAIAGMFLLTQRVLQSPLGVVSNSLGSVLLAVAPEMHRQGQLKNQLIATYSQLCILLLPPLAVVFISSPLIFGLVFGAQWIDAGYLARRLVPWIYVWSLASTFSVLNAALQRQRSGLIFNLTLLAAQAAALMGVDHLYGAMTAITVYAGASILVRGSYLINLLTECGVTGRELVAPQVKAILISIEVIAFPTIAIATGSSDVIQCLSVAASVGVYLLLCSSSLRELVKGSRI